MIALLWIAFSVVTILLLITAASVHWLNQDVIELKKRIRTMDDGVWFSNKLSNLEWRIEQVEPVKQRETISLEEYRRLRSRS